MNKKSLLNAFLTAIMISGLILACAMRFGTDVNGIPKPSVPEFTVKLVAHPYDVPSTTTTTIDEYTGKEIVTTTPGYHVENKSIEITIKNQPFTPYTDADGNEINIYYNVRVKGHFGQDWTELYSPYSDSVRGGYYGSYSKSPVQSSSEYTVLSLSADYPDGAQVDYQVNAHAGYYTDYWPYVGVGGFIWLFNGEFSGWSNTQTITIGESQTPTPSPTTTPTQTPSPVIMPTPTPYQESQQIEQEILIGAAIAAAVIGAGLGLLIYLIKRK
jgi:hypothetical protein